MRTSAGPGMVPALLAAGTRLGAWEIESPIAAGGMGQVYRARRADGVYDQSVALKLIHDRDSHRVERFAAERQRLAEMDHPGIARIIDGGTHDDGRPWMAMELVDGAPILPQAEGLPRRKRLELFVSLCAAVSHAHGRLVLHRDIKAANVLLDAAGQVRLIDFGISTLSEAGAAPGGAYTPATAAPEQLRGDAPTVATDVFALGVLLHQLLVGQLPVRQDDGALTPNNPAIADADLAAIVARATALVAAARYASVDGLADDVQAALDHRPVAARGGGTAYRIGRFMRRFPVASGLAAAFVAALVGGIVVSASYAREAEREAARARAELKRAEYFLAFNDTVNEAREAYADALQAMFASDADTERLTRLLKTQWSKAHANRKANPAQAAALSYAIGRHFVYRNDYVTGLEILEPWLNEAYGPPELLQLGRRTLATAYQYSGRGKAAEALIREQLKVMASGYDAFSPDHAALASDLALLTRKPADLLAAEQLLVKVAGQPDHPPDILSFLWNQTGLMRNYRGDRAGQLTALRTAVQISEDNPLTSSAGRDTRRINLANAEFHNGGSVAAAKAWIARVLSEDLSQSGLNREIGQALELRGEIAMAEGQLPQAISDLEKAAEIVARFSGTASGQWPPVQAALVEALVRAGRTDAARKALAALEKREAAVQKPNRSTTLSRAYVLSAEGNLLEAGRLLEALAADPANLREAKFSSRLARARAWLADCCCRNKVSPAPA